MVDCWFRFDVFLPESLCPVKAGHGSPVVAFLGARLVVAFHSPPHAYDVNDCVLVVASVHSVCNVTVDSISEWDYEISVGQQHARFSAHFT